MVVGRLNAQEKQKIVNQLVEESGIQGASMELTIQV